MGDTENRWEGKPVRAFVIRAFAFVAPVAAALLVAFWLSKAIPRPSTWGLFALWWLSILVISTIVLRVTERFARKLLPLAALLKLTLVFPDRAPTRFTMSMRTGGAETLEEMVAEAEAAGAKDDFASAAETILALAARLNSHDPRTRGHAERVRAYADMIAEEMGFDDEDRNKVKWACMLHDIGKLKVPLEIINKPGRLTDEEYEVIKNHPTWGMELAAPLLPWLGDFASGIGQHHERFDGFGYPDGVAGTEIGLAGRIAAVADTFDVITSVRSYKQARPASEAREELARCAGSQFDPEVVRAFLNIGLGRQRWVAGPLSWLGQVPMVQSVVQGLTTAASNAGAVVSTATAATAIGAASIIAPALFPSVPQVAELPPSPAVVAVDDTALVDEDGSITLDTIANDEGEIVSVNVLVPPANGTARVVDNNLVYTPNPGYSGTDTIRYEVCDASGNCDEAVVTVTVNPVNDLPEIVVSLVDGVEDETLLINITSLVTDPDGTLDTSTLRVIGTPTSGVASVTGAGQIRYIPGPDFNGTDTIAYEVCDNDGGCVTGSVTVDVAAVNDPPEVTVTPASGPEDGSVFIPVDAFDRDGDPVTTFIIRQPANGFVEVGIDGNLTYTPNPDYHGVDSFEISVCDPTGLCANVTVTVPISSVNDAPVVPSRTYTTGEDQPVTFDPLEGITDVDGDVISLFAFNATSAKGGTIAAGTGNLTYTPPVDFNGSDTFTYTISDGTVTQTVTVTITINGENDPASGAALPATATEDNPLIVNILGGFIDPEGDPLTISSFIVNSPAGASFVDNGDGTVTITLPADYNGPVTVTYGVSDGLLTTTRTSTFTITPVADAPRPVDDSTATSALPVVIDVVANDYDPENNIDPNTLSLLTSPTKGVVTIVGPGQVQYTPLPLVTGPDSFTYQICDTTGLCSPPATVFIGLLGPDTVDDTADAPEETTTTIDVLANDTDPDNNLDPLTLSIVTPPTNGTASVVAANINYTSNIDYVGADNLVYEVCDTEGACGRATLSLNIININDAPRPMDDAYSLNEDPASPLGFDVLANDTDVDPGDNLSFDSFDDSTITNGTLTHLGSGVFEYTPFLNFNGVETFTYTVIDTFAETATATVTITTNPINDIPVANDDGGAGFTGDEDTPFTTADVTANDTDVEDGAPDPTTVVIVGATPAGLANNGDGTFDYNPPLNTNGDVVFTYEVKDSVGATSNTATVTITIDAVNDAPSFVKGADETVTEDDPAQTVVGWATAISVGPANESAQSIAGFNVSNDNNGLFATQPAVDASGTLTYTPAANANGSATVTVSVSDDGGTALGGVDTSADQTFVITVDAVNDAPSFVKGADETVTEDDPAQTVVGWATAISVGPANESAQSIAGFNVSNDNNGLFATQPAVDASGTLTYTPAANANGSATVTVSVSDDGGTALGGVDTSADQTFVITVDAVNDAPSFVKGADETVTEDDPAQTVVGWATAISVGPANESAQSIAGFNVSNDNNGLFATQPAVDASGTLTYTPAANANGSATVTVSVSDDGGTALGGVDTSADQTFVITVDAVNDAPSFVKGADETVTEDDPAQTVVGWATAISVGPANESAQSIAGFNVSNDNNGLFATQPAVDASGTLTYTPAANANGSATVTVSVSDDGGTALGGVDTSADQTFVITVDAVNDAPSFVKGADETVTEDDPAQTVVGWATAISVGPANESAQSIAGFNVSNDNNGLFATQPAVDASGTLTYTPAANANGSATVTVSVSDDGGTALGGVDTSADQTFVITIDPVNDPPDIANQAFAVDENVADATVVGTVVASDPEGDPVSYTITAGNGGGWFTIDPNSGQITVNNPPGLDHEAAASRALIVEVKDPSFDSNSAIVTITINDVNDPPVLAAIANQSAIEGIPWSLVVSATDEDVPAQSLTLTESGLPAWATFTDNGDGTATLSGTPGAADVGPNVVTITVTDGVDADAQPFSLDVFAAGGAIVINEVLYEEQLASGDEFIELYNGSGGAIDLTGWTIADGKQTPPPDVDPNGSRFSYIFPPNDATSRPSTLAPGEYAVIWLQSRGGNNIAPFVALEFDVALGAEWPLSNIADDLYLYDPGMGLSDYITWGDKSLLGSEQNTPPPTVWDDAYDVDNWNAIPVQSGTSLSLTPTGIDSGHSACWEATGSGDAGTRPECSGAPATYQADVGRRLASPGLNNNLPYPHSTFEHQVVINEVMHKASDFEFVELYNASGGAIDLGGWLLADGNARTADLDGGGSRVTYTIPASTMLPPGGYAVIWLQDNGPTRQAPEADVQLWANANNSTLNGSGDDAWLFDSDLELVDYVAWGGGGNVNDPPQPISDFWDNSNQGALSLPPNDNSISLTTSGVDTDDSNCWEGSGSGASACGPTTVDNDETFGRVGSVGEDNNLAKADISLAKSVSASQPTQTNTITYTVTVTNNSTSNASTGVEVTDLLPAGVTWVSDDSAGAYVPATGVWTVGALAQGASASLNIDVTVTAGPTTTVDNAATITAFTTPDPNTSNNNDSASFTVNQQPAANDDNATAVSDNATTMLVLGNDSDPDTDPLTITAYDAVSTQGGMVDCSGGTSCTYTSPAAFVSGPTDSFTYTIGDGNGGSAIATVTVTVLPAPSVVVSEFSYNGAYSGGDFVELYNPTGSSMPIGGLVVRFDDEVGSTGNDVTVPGPQSLAAGEHYLIVEAGSALDTGTHQTWNPDNTNASFGVQLEWAGTPVDAVGTGPRANGPIVAATAAYREGAGVPPMFADASFPNQSYEREAGLTAGNCVDTDDNRADFYRNYLGGSANPEGLGVIESCGTLPPPTTSASSLVISEYRTDGPLGGGDEFTEIFNPTSAPIQLVGLELYDAGAGQLEYLFLVTDAGDGFLDPGEYMVIAGPAYGGSADAAMVGGGIGNGGAHIQLRTVATAAVIDAVGPGLPVLDGRVDQTYERKGNGCVDTNAVTDWFHQLAPNPTLTIANGGSTYTCP